MITIEPYDPGWPARFEAEAASIRRVLCEPPALRVEHVGSTAVAGLAAKPVIDIQVSVSSLQPLGTYVERLAQIGYGHVPLGPIDMVYPFFRKPHVWPSTHHVHLCVIGSEQERSHLVFRNYLHNHPLVAAEYAELKRQLASVHHGGTIESLERYSLSKSGFVNSVLIRADTDVGA